MSKKSAHHPPAPVPAPATAMLTAREHEVLGWLAVGKRDGEIATILGASVRTIHKHVQRILAKLGVETRTAAARLALEAEADARDEKPFPPASPAVLPKAAKGVDSPRP